MINYREEGLKDVEPYIKMVANEGIRKFLREALRITPAYFWEIPASSSGKYHPKWAVQKRGLFWHSIFAMYLASELSTTFGLTPLERDVAIAACCLHDTVKYGIDYDLRYYDMHSYMPRTFFSNKDHNLSEIIGRNLYHSIMSAIETHMGTMYDGSWNPVRKKPENTIETVVHLADYIASRKQVNFNLI